MSFAFDWGAFTKNQVFLEKCKDLLDVALNKNTPPIIEGPITVKELCWGSQEPILETLEIGEVGNDRFRGIFKLNYDGDGFLTLSTKVQANLLNVYAQTASSFALPSFLGAAGSLSIPLNLTLSDFKMSGIVICVFSRSRGLTCVFRNDPLQSIKVSSTFDDVPGIAGFLQSQIENLIRGLFREELPAILYRHSQQWTRQAQQDGDIYLQHKKLQEQLQIQESERSNQPIKFSEIDSDKQVSLVNMLRMEAMGAARRTLSVSTPTVSTTILRSELSRRHATSSSVPVSISGEHIYEHVHTQAQKLAVKSNHKPRRRVLHRKKKVETTEPAVPELAAIPEVVGAPVERAKSEPAEYPVEVENPQPERPVTTAGSQPSTLPTPSTPASTPVEFVSPAHMSSPQSVPPAPLVSDTKAEIERIKSVLGPPRVRMMPRVDSQFFVSNRKLMQQFQEDEGQEPGVPPPAYVL